MPELMIYRTDDIEDEDAEEQMDLSNIINNTDENFKRNCQIVLKEINKAFEIVTNHTLYLKPYIKNYHENIRMKIEDYATKELDDIKAILTKLDA